jgi:hypothetical protein
MTKFNWRGCRLVWKHDSWPKFSNQEQPDRPAYVEVSPHGTQWEATVNIGTIKSKPRRGDTPVGALENALEWLDKELAALRAIPIDAGSAMVPAAEKAANA